MFSWQQKKLPQRQREPCLAPTRRMRFKISLLSTMSILKKKPVTAMRHTLQTLKDGVASLPTAMKSSSSTPTQQSIKQSCTLSHTIKTPAHDDVLAMQASIDSSTPIATADTSIDGQADNIVELPPPFSSTSMPLTPAAQRQSTSPKLPSAFCTPTKSNKKRLSADDAIIDQLTSPVFNNTCITSSSSSSSSSPGMLMWPFDETSSNAKEQMSKEQAVDATSSSPLLVSSPTMKTQESLDLLELPFFTEASPIIAMQQDSKKPANNEPSPSPSSISNEEQTNKALSPIRCTLPSPDIGNTTSNVQIPSSPTPALQHSANASALWIANDECTKTSTSSKSKLLSFSNKKSNMMSNPRTPLSPLALANNTKKQSVTNALVSSKTPPPTSAKSTSTSTFKHASLANKSNVPAKNTFKAPAPISKRKRNGNSSNDSSKISPTYNIENYFIKSKAASINEGTAKKENTTTTTTSSLASSLQKAAFRSTPSLFCSATSESTTKKDADGFCRPPSIKRKRSGIEDNTQSCSFLKRKVLPLATRSHTMPNPSTSNDSDDDVFLSVSTSLQQRQRRDTRRLSSPQLGLNEQVMRKRTRVSVHTNGGIYKPRYAERSLSESAVNHIGACHSSAPHTPPSTRRCSSPSNPIESTKSVAELQEQPSSTTSQTIVHGSDSFMSPMSRRIIAAAGMRRFGETMPMDMLKSNLVNPFL